MRIRTYSELRQIQIFDDRFEYLKLGGGVGRSTFGFDRYLNQKFYKSREWKDIRHFVIARDNGCDLGIPGYEIHVDLCIHHMNPIGIDDIANKIDDVLNPEYLITTTHYTHNAIHYGVEKLTPKVVTKRSPGDTKLW